MAGSTGFGDEADVGLGVGATSAEGSAERGRITGAEFTRSTEGDSCRTTGAGGAEYAEGGLVGTTSPGQLSKGGKACSE